MGDKIMARLVLFVVMVGVGVLVLGMAQAAVSGRLGRNPVAGIRLPVTMASDSAWLTAHQAEKRPTQWAGWGAIAFALLSVLPSCFFADCAHIDFHRCRWVGRLRAFCRRRGKPCCTRSS
ncbi:SdpI family protein [Cryobacterium sp. Hb1]|uniref:SdpI family protein n=1 Tax=Cryobacterium sp. Hb1 TaxID=1259147 RepID=UPI00106C7B57|nr:SdpI family protein [Cryobacterium sp. Hb1]TFD69041.1 SdpI family protein [Cryobacterium sp. Hb1]